jgi:hypothetical protein
MSIHPLVALAVIAALPIVWLITRGPQVSNLSPAVSLWLGIVSGLVAFHFRKLQVLIAISSTFVLLGMLEFGAWILDARCAPDSKVYSYSGDPPVGFIAEHPAVGYAFRGPARLWVTATIGDEVIYDSVRYSIDTFSRRTCEPTVESPRHALFFGGSFAFGEGLTNQQTISCQFQAVSGNQYQSYNYAMMGWGPSQTYNQLGFDDLFEDIQQRSGIAVYSFIGEHIRRTTWNISNAAEYPEYPFFALSKNGDLEGPFKTRDRRRLRVATQSFRFLHDYSPLFRTVVNPSLIRAESDEEAVLTTARVLAAARRRYQNRFDGEFIVLLWPRSRLLRDLENLLIKELSTLGVPVVQVPPLPGPAQHAYLHPKDSHPNAEETAWIAKSLHGEVLSLGANSGD